MGDTVDLGNEGVSMSGGLRNFSCKEALKRSSLNFKAC